jgi:hypothetical protein
MNKKLWLEGCRLHKKTRFWLFWAIFHHWPTFWGAFRLNEDEYATKPHWQNLRHIPKIDFELLVSTWGCLEVSIRGRELIFDPESGQKIHAKALLKSMWAEIWTLPH